MTSTQPNLKLDGCTITVNNRGINMYPVGGCTNGKLELIGTTIQNSRVTGDYADNTTVGDTRGIALYGVQSSNINITNSYIYGFGYSINTSADVGTNGVRPGGNTYTITNSNIWGWSAFNVWSVNNIFNITNSNLRGINRLDSDWNNFATFVINNGIYNGNSSYANQVNITGGSVQAYAYGTAEHADFLESSESITQFAFSKYNNAPVYLIYPEGSTVFAVSYPGTTVNITGAENVVQIAASNS